MSRSKILLTPPPLPLRCWCCCCSRRESVASATPQPLLPLDLAPPCASPAASAHERRSQLRMSEAALHGPCRPLSLPCQAALFTMAAVASLALLAVSPAPWAAATARPTTSESRKSVWIVYSVGPRGHDGALGLGPAWGDAHGICIAGGLGGKSIANLRAVFVAGGYLVTPCVIWCNGGVMAIGVTPEGGCHRRGVTHGVTPEGGVKEEEV